MMKIVAALLFCLASFASCHKTTSSATCDIYVPPAVTGLSFRLLDKTTGADLYVLPPPLGYDRYSLTAVQPCYAGTPVPQFQLYPIPGQNNGYARVFSFENIRNVALTEAPECFRLYLQFKAGDVDTMEWHYHNEQSGNCTLQKLDFVLFNGDYSQQVDSDGITYWPLRK